MATLIDDVTNSIATRVKTEREARNWSLADLAKQSKVSKAMISKIERGESSPTTLVLGRLCGAFGLTLSTFLTRAEGRSGRLIRASEQSSWVDPGSGCVRTLITPSAGGDIELVAVELPAGSEVSFPASIYATFYQIVLVQKGHLALLEGETEHLLYDGDCLELGPPSNCVFSNKSNKPCRYLVAASRRE